MGRVEKGSGLERGWLLRDGRYPGWGVGGVGFGGAMGGICGVWVGGWKGGLNRGFVGGCVR